jgi:hypothetical protein
MGDPSVRITLPMPMKKLDEEFVSLCLSLSRNTFLSFSLSLSLAGIPSHVTNPNVAPDPAMYWPSVLMIPFGPAPYRKMLTVPVQGGLAGYG